jgi:hypothetical protein
MYFWSAAYSSMPSKAVNETIDLDRVATEALRSMSSL